MLGIVGRTFLVETESDEDFQLIVEKVKRYEDNIVKGIDEVEDTYNIRVNIHLVKITLEWLPPQVKGMLRFTSQ